MMHKTERTLGFVLASVLPAVFICIAMHSLAATTPSSDTYSHIPLIPVVSFYLIYLDRQRIFSESSAGRKVGSLFCLAGLACLAAGLVHLGGIAQQNVFSIEMLGLTLTWTGVFAFFFGSKALRAASFPFLFLIFMVPIPEPFLSHTIFVLQEGSANVTAFVFSALGVPFLRQGFDFSLPGVTIRIAEECSGIRSALALFIMSVLAGHLFLARLRNKIILCVLVFPLAVFKNGLRIVALSTLAIYVDAGFLHGRLHQYGGVVFFGTALVPLALLLLLFQQRERTRKSSMKPAPSTA
jgi:exosortase